MPKVETGRRKRVIRNYELEGGKWGERREELESECDWATLSHFFAHVTRMPDWFDFRE